MTRAFATHAEPAQSSHPGPLAPPTKRSLLIELLVSESGATLNQMISATSWLPHTTRAALTGLKNKGYTISSEKVGGVRTYRAIAPRVAS